MGWGGEGWGGSWDGWVEGKREKERGEHGGWMERWGGMVSALLSCLRIVEFLPRPGQKKEISSKSVEERDGSLSACRANLRAGTFPQVSSQAFMLERTGIGQAPRHDGPGDSLPADVNSLHLQLK